MAKLRGPYVPQKPMPEIGMKTSDLRKMLLAQRSKNYSLVQGRAAGVPIMAMFFFVTPILTAIFVAMAT